MKTIITLLLSVSVICAENEYQSITKRNAFQLGRILPPASQIISTNKPPVKVYLTGIMKYRGVTNVFLYSKDLPKRFLTLNHKNEHESGIKLLSVKDDLIEIDNNGILQELCFENDKLPNIIGPTPVFKNPTVVKKKSKNNEKKDKEAINSAPQPSVIKVPSRRPSIDPRIVQKGLEYIDKIEDKEKKEYILNRLETLQSGQQQINGKIDENERRRRYDNSRKDRTK